MAEDLGLDGEATLAVHLRLTDKVHDEAKENALLSDHTIIEKIKGSMSSLACTKVFLCSDAQSTKSRIQEQLTKQGIRCVTYHSALSTNETVGLHFSEVPPHVSCQDIAVEVALMAGWCLGLLATRSNIMFMVAVLGAEDFVVIDMLTDRVVGSRAGTNLPNAPHHNVPAHYFKSDSDPSVEGLWLKHNLCAVQIRGHRYQAEDFATVLTSYAIIKSVGECEQADESSDAEAQLRGFLAEWHQVLVVRVTKFEPPRVGWGSAQNKKILKHAAALSVLVPYVLDQKAGHCHNAFVTSFCKLAATKRPPA